MTRTLGRTALAGVACAILLIIVGSVIERTLLGSEGAEARRRVERDVHDLFAVRTTLLKQAAQRAASLPVVKRALADDEMATRSLFASARTALADAGTSDAGVTIYDADRNPLAWAGRPSELGFERFAGGEAWFIGPSGLGLRLVYVAPILDAGTRLGTVATEIALPNADVSRLNATAIGTGTSFWLPTRLADVRLDVFGDARTRSGGNTFDVLTPNGQRLVTASISDRDLETGRERWRQAIHSLVLITIGLTLLLLAAPLLDWRNRSHGPRGYLAAAGLAAVALVGGRLLLRWASPADWSNAEVFSGASYASPLFESFLASPFDFLVDALTVGGLVAIASFAVEAWRLHRWTSRRPVAAHLPLFVLMQLGAGMVATAVLLGHEALIRDTIAHATLDLLHFSLHPWNNARMALQVGLVLVHTSVLALAILILRAALIPWRLPRRSWPLRVVLVGAWVLPLMVLPLLRDVGNTRHIALIGAGGIVVALALSLTRLEARYRRGSQAFRLMLLTLGLIVPTFVFYPIVFQVAWEAKSQLVETRFAPQARDQRETVTAQLRASLQQIDRFQGLRDLIVAPTTEDADTVTDRAFQVWQTTALAAFPMTSSIELYRANGTLVSRFAFNLPEDLTATPRSDERDCHWDLFEESAPFFAEERRVLHAGRALCINDDPTRVIGSIIVHAMLDYGNLPFIQSETPYVQLLRPQESRAEGVSGRDVEFAVYGWSRTPFYSSNEAAWPLTDDAFTVAEQSREPAWARLRRNNETYDVYLLNDRFGIYALGFPVVAPLGHLVNLAELIVLSSLTYLFLLAGGALFGWLGGRATTAPKLLREVRASFYRKLFLAFVAAVIFPVVALAFVTRQYVADEMRSSVAQEAVRTAAAARRVAEDLVAPPAAQQGVPIDDNLMVWISRLIDQDVNIFFDSHLVATSERTLFASGLLPTRIPADVYEALTLRREAAVVTREAVGPIDYLVAGTPLTPTVRLRGATLTVPLTSRERQIEDQIDTFDRRVLLAALLFILGGSWLGYRMAERIADPVNRLTRATRRIARGDLDVRVAATSSDELRRLVDDFNSMAADLQRQRGELERTHRLEAWAEMARQVAHEIKNPLTPIQLNAEHLRRVHADRGEPLSPILQDCVATILHQVTLLRQIASEFSSFASSPTARPAAVDVAAMLREIIDPYRQGLAERIQFDVEIPMLPPVYVDRTLIARSITNIVENALHAMPRGGTLGVKASKEQETVRIRVSDTGVGMDAEALARAFEPYFSTKATGTGLGLPIAKRNVELNGGTIDVISERDRGTTVEIALPIATSEARTM